MKSFMAKKPGLLILAIAFIISQILLAFLILKSNKNVSYKPCQNVGGTQKIIIDSDGFKPKDSTVTVCTKVLFENVDSSIHFPAFGEHDHHEEPDGFTEKVLAAGSTNEFVAHSPATLKIHDHLNDDFTGTLTIKP